MVSEEVSEIGTPTSCSPIFPSPRPCFLQPRLTRALSLCYVHHLCQSDLAELCERVIMSLFACPLDSTASSVPNPSSPTSRPAPRLSEFIAYALHRTRLPLAVTHQALFLLKRLKSRFPAARGSSGHRLFISALMLASKSTCDDTYSNKSWTIVGQGLFSLREVNQMERELFGYLGFKVNVENEELSEFVDGLEHGRIHTSTVTPPASVTSPALATPEVIPSVVHSPMTSDTPSFGSAASSQSSLPSTSPYHHNHHRGSISSTTSSSSASSSSYRPPVVGPSLSSRASIAGYPASSHAAAAAQAMANVDQLRPSTSHPASVSAPSLHSEDANRPNSSHSYRHHANHHHGFGSHVRERSRPYTMPTNHNVALNSGSSSNGHHGYYASPSPSGSMSSSSLSSCGSLSAGSSSSMSSCATPSSTHDFSGHSTPDTPPTEFSNSPWISQDEKAFEDDEVNDEYRSMDDDRRESMDSGYESQFRYNLNNAQHYHHTKAATDESQRRIISQHQYGAHPYGNWQ